MAVKKQVPKKAVKVRLAGPFKITGNAPAELKRKFYYINEYRKARQIVQLGKSAPTVKGWLAKTRAGRWRAHPNGARKAMTFLTRRSAALYLVGAMAPVNKPVNKTVNKTGKRNPTGTATKPIPPLPKLTTKELAKITKTFTGLRAKAAEKYPKVVQTSLRLDPSIHKKPRSFGMAGIEKSGPTVYVAPELAKQSLTRIQGVLGHELGHIIVLIGYLPAKRGYDATERQADAVAEDAFGQKMFYGKDDVQAMGRGAKGVRPRPKGLR